MNLRIDEVPTSPEALAALVAQYRERYEAEFGYQLPEDVATVELVNARAAAIGLTDDVELPRSESGGDAEAARKGSREVYFDEAGDFTTTPIFDRALLEGGAAIDGPAVIEQIDTTVLVPPGASARVDAYRNIVIDVGSPGDARAVAAAGSTKGEPA